MTKKKGLRGNFQRPFFIVCYKSLSILFNAKA